MRILIANRGEIARRIQRTAHRLGHETVAAWADPDREAPFVNEATLSTRLGPAELGASYLSESALLSAAARTGATAIHPGYGFLSENGSFARAVVEAGLIWIGPRPEAIEKMGSKIEARRLAVAAGVPIIPGYDASQASEDLAAAAERIGFPILVKAAAGGGGKGIRIVREADELERALDEARLEAERNFKNGALIVERFVQRARHIEVQIVGDQHGAVVDLGTRECSVQRRYQKLLEEAPAPNLRASTSDGMRSAARKLARSIGYDSAGTVEFVVDEESGEFFFLEMNTRLQVEHPVTEETMGLDLVEWQIAVAEGQALPLGQEEIVSKGHAFEVRINAEDARNGFMPKVGSVQALEVPEGVRWDSGIELGSEISPHYDSMIAKLIVHGPDRDTARRRLAKALDCLVVGSVVTNSGFHRWLVERDALVEARTTTSLLEDDPYTPSSAVGEGARLAAHVWRIARARDRQEGPWDVLGSWRTTQHRPSVPTLLCDQEGDVHEVVVGDEETLRLSDCQKRLAFERSGTTVEVAVSVCVADRLVVVNLAGECLSFRVLSRSEYWSRSEDDGIATDTDAIRAPFPAVVAETPVSPGDRVEAGDVVIVIEAMKMLHSLRSRAAAVIAEVPVEVGMSVESNTVLIEFEQGNESEDNS